jgi:hypothetical protein
MKKLTIIIFKTVNDFRSDAGTERGTHNVCHYAFRISVYLKDDG